MYPSLLCCSVLLTEQTAQQQYVILQDSYAQVLFS